MESTYHWNLGRKLRLIPRFPNFAKQNIGSARFCRLAGDVHSRCIRFNIHDLHLPQILLGKARQPLWQISLTPRLSKSASNTVVFARINDAWRWTCDRWTRKSLNQHLLIPLYIFWYFLITSKVTGQVDLWIELNDTQCTGSFFISIHPISMCSHFAPWHPYPPFASLIRSLVFASLPELEHWAVKCVQTPWGCVNWCRDAKVMYVKIISLFFLSMHNLIPEICWIHAGVNAKFKQLQRWVFPPAAGRWPFRSWSKGWTKTVPVPVSWNQQGSHRAAPGIEADGHKLYTPAC